MKDLFIFGLIALLGYAILGYKTSIEYIDRLVPVAIAEVPIPRIYGPVELNNYCKYEWSVLRAKNCLIGTKGACDGS